MAKRKTKAAEDEWFSTEESRAKAAWDHVTEIRKLAREAADKGDNAGKAFPYTQRLHDLERYSMSMLLQHVYEFLAAAREKRESLEARVAELEANPLDYVGVYEEGKSYPARKFVSHGGSVWWTSVKTKARPGEGRDWILAVKAGRAGRDAK